MNNVTKSRTAPRRGVERKNKKKVIGKAINKADTAKSTTNVVQECSLYYLVNATLSFKRNGETHTGQLIEQMFLDDDPDLMRSNSITFAEYLIDCFKPIFSLFNLDHFYDPNVEVECAIFLSKLKVTVSCVVEDPWDMAEIYSRSISSGESDKVFCSGLFKEYEFLSDKGHILEINPEEYFTSKGEIMSYFPIFENPNPQPSEDDLPIIP